MCISVTLSWIRALNIKHSLITFFICGFYTSTLGLTLFQAAPNWASLCFTFRLQPTGPHSVSDCTQLGLTQFQTAPKWASFCFRLHQTGPHSISDCTQLGLTLFQTAPNWTSFCLKLHQTEAWHSKLLTRTSPRVIWSDPDLLKPSFIHFTIGQYVSCPVVSVTDSGVCVCVCVCVCACVRVLSCSAKRGMFWGQNHVCNLENMMHNWVTLKDWLQQTSYAWHAHAKTKTNSCRHLDRQQMPVSCFQNCQVSSTTLDDEHGYANHP